MTKKISFNIDKVSNLLLENNIVAIPTETVFGIFAKINQENKKRINSTKKRNKNQQIQVSFPNLESMYEFVEVSDYQKSILESELPGNKSFILRTSKKGKNIVKNDTILVRVPSKFFSKKLVSILEKTGPLYSTSANLHNRPEILKYKDIKLLLDLDYVVKSNIKGDNKPSKIFSLVDDEIKLIRK